MSSSIIVVLGTGKKQTVKTTPMMILRQIVQTVCEKQHYTDPESYGLKSGNNTLDLSLSVRYANVLPGTKLELVKVPKTTQAASVLVTIALQLEDGQRIIQTVPSTATLWDVLLSAEQSSNGTLNLTRRTGAEPATIKNMFALQRRLSRKATAPPQVYMLPVVTVLEREYSSFKSLKSTTLELAGVASGNAVLRVVMRHKGSGIEKYMEEIERLPTTAQVADQSTSAPQQPQRYTLTDNSIKDLRLPAPVPVVVAPEISGRAGSIDTFRRDGIPGAPSNNGNGSPGSNGDLPRQTPVQEINSSMVEVTQEIRQLREQQTQEALTDRVKRLSKSSDSASSDKDRFVRSMTLPTVYDEPEGVASNYHNSRTTRTTIPLRSTVPLVRKVSTRTQSQPLPQESLGRQQSLVKRIAHRVSQQLREAQQRGESRLNYHSLIAREIVKEQRAGSLPNSPAESCKNSAEVNVPPSRA
ncbi:hypothetical protein BGX28_002865 [Mortierella sp. GBA30]|nr:hypothetical protein BGX28_002865 [Mortierella sp. GBA30]